MTSEFEFPSYPGWKTVHKIGTGSYGSVYEIERDLLGKKEYAALKVVSIPQDESDVDELYSSGFDQESIVKRLQTYLEDIIREYQLMTEIRGHTNIVYCDDIQYIPKANDFGWDVYIKMELLTPLVKSLGLMSTENDVVRLGIDICKALVLCESRNILHRDIKPQNVFISRDGNFKLGDFGIAKMVEQTSGGTKIGSYSFMAPEVFNYEPYGHAADIYSLGLVMYWFLNEQRLPFICLPPDIPTSEELNHARKRRFRGEKLPAPAHGSEMLKQIVLKACEFDPKARFSSAEEMLARLTYISKVPSKGEPLMGKRTCHV